MKPIVTNKKPGCIIALGGSAGSLEALERFVSTLHEGIAGAFVIIQHMDPKQKSHLAELLSRKSPLPVHRAEHGQLLRSGNIYVCEPGQLLTLSNVMLVSRPTEGTEERQHPIDHFFASLARECRSHGVGIVLSGNGSDGTEGLRKIREAGGRAYAQLPTEARFDGMPSSAIEAEVVDRVLSVDSMVDTLSALMECAPDGIAGDDHGEKLDQICEELHRKTGHDFSSYKKSTVARRVERRVQARQLKTLDEYLDLLVKDPSEPRELLRDLLISVTQFFRDPEAFDHLKEAVIPRIFENVRKGEAIRIWVPACATGEEAYTLAILFKDYARERGNEAPVQLFATDIDRSALETARLGVYPATIAEHIPPYYLKTYFKPHERGFQAAQELREICIFSEHSLLKNPPFSRMDLISCRNLFIYWEPELQNRILPVFHYSLNPAGFLFLGPAENVAATLELFKPIEKKFRIFQKVANVSRSLSSFPVAHFTGRSVATENAQKSPLFGEGGHGRSLASILLENFAPPAFVVTEHGEVAFYSGKTARYIDPPTGVPTNNIFDLVSRPLRSELHGLLHRCVKTGSEVSTANLAFEKDGSVQAVKVTVQPFPHSGGGPDLYLVVIQDVQPSRTRKQAARDGIVVPEESTVVQRLQEELRDTRERLQSTIEEVRSSNEELLSMNEELQSANEELQTSKEELQSTNEELETVNSELAKRVEELDASNSDLQNFFQSSQIPILFLDRRFRIQKFTPNATRIFRLIPSDIGRNITDIVSLLEDDDITRDFEDVLQTLQPVERAMKSRDGKSNYIMRVSPYRTVNNVIAGVVLIFSDVTELTRAQGAKMTLAAIVESSSDAIISKDLTSKIMSWNDGASAVFGYTAEEAIGKSIKMLIPPELQHEEDMILGAIFKGERIHHYETVRLRKDGRRIHISLSVSPVRDENGKIIGAAKIARDISEQKKSEQALKDAIRARDEFLSLASHELKTPLTSMHLQTQMRRRNVQKRGAAPFGGEEVLKMVESDERQIRRITRLIDDMLDVARISSGRLAIHFEPTDLGAMVQEVIERFSAEAIHLGTRLTAEIADGVFGEWDRFRLEQVVTNLLNNALKYGGGKPVHVSVRPEGDSARIEVSDQGIGIAPEDCERIFQQFERAVSSSEISGLGLGLFIVRQIIEAHRGRISVRSELGKGSCFTIVLPLSNRPQG